MARRTNLIHFRADDALVERLEALTAESATGNRSAVIRSLLYGALGNSTSESAALQSLYDANKLRRIIFNRLEGVINDALPQILEDVLANEAQE